VPLKAFVIERTPTSICRNDFNALNGEIIRTKLFRRVNLAGNSRNRAIHVYETGDLVDLKPRLVVYAYTYYITSLHKLFARPF